MSKCLNAQILIAAPIREAIPVADLVQDLQDQAVLVLGDPRALVRVDLVVLGTMIVLLVAILVIGLRVVMTGALMIGLLVATEQIPAQVLLGDHLVLVRVGLVVLAMMIVRRVVIMVIGLLVAMTGVVLVTVRRVEILVIGHRVVMIGAQMTVRRVVILVIGLLVGMIGVQMIVLLVVTSVIVRHVGMTGVQMIVRLAVTLVTVPRVVMTGAQMIGLLVGTVLALVGRLVRAVMTSVMVGDEAVPVKKILLPASRVMRPSGGVQQFVHAVLVPFVRT